MATIAVFWCVVRFAVWETVLFAAAIRLADRAGWRRRPVERWLAVLAIQVTLESTCAALLSFARMNSAAAYWIVAGVVLVVAQAFLPVWGVKGKSKSKVKTNTGRNACATLLLLSTPLIVLAFRPVQEIDSINYLHYMLDWMANRATPYTFATGYVAFWELSFLPAWTITRVDLFFPILALKSVALLALAAWLAGRELGLRRGLLFWTVTGSMTMRHLWHQYSGVPTLKNDALHGAGFVLLALVVLRAARRRLTRTDIALLAFGAAFASVKYSGIFLALPAFAAVLWLQRGTLRRNPRAGTAAGLAVAALVTLTSGHYYLRTLLLHGSPFYPFQINLGPLHLPGTADLSNTSILYSLGDPRLWRLFFLPAHGLSPVGVLFPLALAAALAIGTFRVLRAGVGWAAHRVAPSRMDWAAAAILCGWFLYFRSVYSASASPGDLGFLLNDLSTIRYQDGVLAVTELWLVALLAPFGYLAPALVGVNLASRLAMLYTKLPAALFPWWLVLGVAAAAYLGATALRRRPRAAALAAASCLAVVGPFVVERNRAQWTAFWNDLKPALAAARGPGLAQLSLPEFGYFAGHVVAAGNPVHPEVRSISAEEMNAAPAAARPRYLAVLAMPGGPADAWRAHSRGLWERWGYVPVADGRWGTLLEREFEPVQAEASQFLDAWYAPRGMAAMSGMPVPGGHVLRRGDLVVSAAGELLRLAPEGRQPLRPAEGLRIRLPNCGSPDAAGKPLGAVYKYESGRWARDGAPAGLSGGPAIGEGGYTRDVRADDRAIRLTAKNDASFLAWVGWYPPSLPDNTPVTIRTVVRCPKECVLANMGRVHSVEERIPAGGWTAVHLELVYRRAEDPQHYSIGIGGCRAGDWLEIREFEMLPGFFPF